MTQYEFNKIVANLVFETINALTKQYNCADYSSQLSIDWLRLEALLERFKTIESAGIGNLDADRLHMFYNLKSALADVLKTHEHNEQPVWLEEFMKLFRYAGQLLELCTTVREN